METSRRRTEIRAPGAMHWSPAAARPDRADDRTCWTVAPTTVWRTRLSAISRPVWSASSASLRLRLRLGVSWRSVELDRALAEGSPPAHRAELELRAQQLTSARFRWSLASDFRAVVTQSERPPAGPTLAPLMFIPVVAALPGAPTPTVAGDTMLDIADALTEPGCTSVSGVARASWLLCDVRNSPLYARLPARTVQRLAREALAALHVEP